MWSWAPAQVYSKRQRTPDWTSVQEQYLDIGPHLIDLPKCKSTGSQPPLPRSCLLKELGLLSSPGDRRPTPRGSRFLGGAALEGTASHCISPKGPWRTRDKGGGTGGQRPHLRPLLCQLGESCYSDAAGCGHCSGPITVTWLCGLHLFFPFPSDTEATHQLPGTCCPRECPSGEETGRAARAHGQNASICSVFVVVAWGWGGYYSLHIPILRHFFGS